MRPPRAATCALLLALVASGCGALDPAGTSQQVVMVTETVATVAGSPVQGGVDAPDAPYVPTEMPAQSAPAPPAADSDLDTIVAVVPGAAGIAMAPVGGGEVRAAGSWQVGVAWSTIKVPLAIAAARLDPQAVEINASAITVSDNQAAENLWAGLGGGEPSAAAVTALLAEGGGTDSRVPSAHTRAGIRSSARPAGL